MAAIVVDGYADGDTIGITNTGYDLEVIKFTARTLNPGAFITAVGAILLCTISATADGDLSSFLSVAENPLFVIHLWMILKDTPYRAIFTIVTGVGASVGLNLAKRTQFYHRICACYLMEIVFHGSLKRLESKKPGIVKLLSDAYNMAPEQFALQVHCPIPNISKLKMSQLIVDMALYLPKFASAARNRAVIGIAGNRLWSLIRWLRTKMTLLATDPDIFHYMWMDEIVANAPYVSFHPMHPLQPLKNASKKLFATLGAMLRERNVALPAPGTRGTALFQNWFRNSLSADVGLTSGELPTLQIIVEATNSRYSIPAILETARVAGTLNPH